jgi:hypothetical protein
MPTFKYLCVCVACTFATFYLIKVIAFQIIQRESNSKEFVYEYCKKVESDRAIGLEREMTKSICNKYENR